MSTLTKTIRAFLPPIIYEAAARWRRGQQGRAEGYRYVPHGWQEAHAYRGWNVESVLENYQATWPRLVREAQTSDPLNLIMGSPEMTLQNTLLCFAYSLALSAHGKESLSVLDWGGAIGQYNLLAQAVLPGVSIEYHCKDVPLLADYGQTLHSNAHFSSDTACLERTYDFVLASSSVQYSEHWQEVLRGLAQATQSYFLLTRIPVSEQGDSYVFSQSAYGSEWLGWSFSRRELLDCTAKSGLTLVREFIISEAPLPIVNAPYPAQQRGFLFRRAQ